MRVLVPDHGRDQIQQRLLLNLLSQQSRFRLFPRRDVPHNAAVHALTVGDPTAQRHLNRKFPAILVQPVHGHDRALQA